MYMCVITVHTILHFKSQMTHVFFLVIVPLFLWKYFFYQLIYFYQRLKNWRLFFYYSNVHFFLGDVFQIYFTIFPEILIKYEVIFLAMSWCSAHLQYTFLSFQWWNLPTESVYGVDTCALRTKLYCSTERRPTLWSSNTSMKLMI